jgi:protease-4
MHNILKATLVFLAVFFAIVVASMLFTTEWQRKPARAAFGRPTVALINLEGVITASSSSAPALFREGGISSVDAVDTITEAADDSSVSGIILRVNSPGGSAAGSDEIYRAIARAKAKKPVVVSMGDVAASGGYYISSAATAIVANQATLTGSIGVIFHGIDLTQLMQKFGVRDQTIAAGKFKDIGSPYRPMTADEKAKLLTMLEGVHTQFIQAVAKGRGMKEEDVAKLADGMIYNGDQAVKLRLVDAVGGLYDAKQKMKELLKTKAEIEVKEYGRKSIIDQLFGSSASLSPQGSLADVTPLSQLARTLFLYTTPSARIQVR